MGGLLKSNAPTLSLTNRKTLPKTRIPKLKTLQLAPRTPQLSTTISLSNTLTLPLSNPKTHFFAAFATGL